MLFGFSIVEGHVHIHIGGKYFTIQTSANDLDVICTKCKELYHVDDGWLGRRACCHVCGLKGLVIQPPHLSKRKRRYFALPRLKAAQTADKKIAKAA